MKKLILLALILLTTSFTYAQEKKLKFSVYTTLDYSNIPRSDLIKHSGKLAFGLGLQSSYEIFKNFDLVVGAAYLDKGYNEEITGPGADDAIQTKVNHWWYAYFSIPVKLQYSFVTRDFKWYAACGIENDFNFDGSGSYIFEDFAQSMVMNIGVSKVISDKLRIGLEPTFRQAIQVYGTQNGNSRAVPDLKPYSVGLKLILTKVK